MQKHKMHLGEIAFHLMVPAVVLTLTLLIGYYAIALVRAIMKF